MKLLVKSTVLAIGAGLAVWGMEYMFLLVHEEVGILPSSALTLGIWTSVLVLSASLVYFTVCSARHRSRS